MCSSSQELKAKQFHILPYEVQVLERTVHSSGASDHTKKKKKTQVYSTSGPGIS